MTKVIIIQRVLEVIDYLFISFFKRFNERKKKQSGKCDPAQFING